MTKITDDLAERGVEVLKRIAVATLSLEDASLIAGWVHDARNALRAQGGASVKPLEWQESIEGYAKGQWFADSIFGEYCTYMHGPSGRAWLQGPQPLREFFDTIDEAKAAAQADYERRIRSALDGGADVTL